MTFAELQLSNLTAIGFIVTGMAAVALIETIVPLHAHGRWHRAHLGPNLALTAITFATNAVLNTATLLGLLALEATGFGLLRLVSLPRWVDILAVVAGLDFAFYVAHVAMHKTPGLWRFHRVHHCDPVIDVTTTIRQHPGEGVIRYAFMAAAAFALGASPAAFAVYRTWSALNGLLEHANIRAPRRIDSFLSLVVTTPNMHKVHHSRVASETDTNYGNIFAIFDRAFGTFTPSARGLEASSGLDGFDDAQTTGALLALPFRDRGDVPASFALP